MPDTFSLMHAKYAIQSIRTQFNRNLDEVEAILDKAIGPMPDSAPDTFTKPAGMSWKEWLHSPD
jgi:hypothetical protein